MPNICSVLESMWRKTIYQTTILFQVISYSSNLTIFISPSTTGLYTCEVNVLGFQSIQSAAQVYSKGPPMITEPEDGSIIYTDVGSSLLIDCVGVGVPAPLVNWDINRNFVHTVKVHDDHISKSETAKNSICLVYKNILFFLVL